MEIKDNCFFNKIDLIPNKSVSIFHINDSISNYLHLPHKIETTNEELYQNQSYYFDNFNIIIWVEDEIIESICCDVECYWKGYNLINLKYETFLNLVNQKPDNESICYIQKNENRGQNQAVYTFYSLGLQAWVWRGRIKTVIVSSYDKEED